MNICDNRLDIRSHINDDDTSPLRVVIDSVWPTAAENELDDRGSRPQKKKTDFVVPQNGAKKWPPVAAFLVFGFTSGAAGKWPHFSFSGNEKKNRKRL